MIAALLVMVFFFACGVSALGAGLHLMTYWPRIPEGQVGEAVDGFLRVLAYGAVLAGSAFMAFGVSGAVVMAVD